MPGVGIPVSSALTRCILGSPEISLLNRAPKVLAVLRYHREMTQENLKQALFCILQHFSIYTHRKTALVLTGLIIQR